MSIVTPKIISQQNKSLLGKVQQQKLFTVWMENSEGARFSIDLPRNINLIKEAIEYSVYRFNELYNFGLVDDINLYQLYAARKNGKRTSDLPSIDHEQSLSMTKLQRFYLKPLYKPTKLQSQNSQSLQSIQLEIEFPKKGSKKHQVLVDKNFGCFCLINK